MTQQVVSFSRLEPITGFTDTFELNPNGRLVWLQRICFWLLDRLQARTVGKLYVRRIDVIPEKLLGYIRLQWTTVRRETGKSATRVFMGPDEFKKVCSQAVDSYTAFSVPIAADRDGQQELYGMKVEIVPWMDGILVLP